MTAKTASPLEAPTEERKFALTVRLTESEMRRVRIRKHFLGESHTVQVVRGLALLEADSPSPEVKIVSPRR